MKNLNKLERFDNTLNGLENELTKLKSTSQAYTKLQELSASYSSITRLFEANSKSLGDLANAHIQKHEEIKKALSSITSENTRNYTELKSLNEAAAKNLNNGLEKLRIENKQFYLDFEKVVRIKLNENKSEIKQLIEYERLKTKELVENETKKITATINSNQQKLNNLILMLGFGSLFLLVVVLIKVFTL